MSGEKVGTGYVPIKPDTDGFGDDLAKGIDDEGGPAATGAGSRVGALFGKAMAAAAVGGLALIGKGVSMFTEFETGMNEVFTLMPDISGQAMEDMSQQVKDFAVDFRVLPQEVVPALYQALSAGVPKDNVFDFLETAQKLAKGGVTDLTTAVDGLSSVVNAYGSDVLPAQQASDLMFTTVKLGKTTIEELSGAIFNVTPTAAGLGVAFGDVTAALAAMTLQGVPTSVATTQLRQMMVELSKAGGKTADTFTGLSGQTFSDFIASGGNMQQALQIMEAGAADAGISISDMFGSVEAGAAALSLTGQGTEAFTTAMAGMQDSAGATDAAYARMSEGSQASMDKMKAQFAVLMINIGTVFAPMVAKVFDVLSVAISKLPPVIEWIKEAIGTVVDVVKRNWPTIKAIAVGVFDAVTTAGTFLIDNVLKPLGEALKSAFVWLMDNKEFLIGIGAAIAVGLVALFVSWAVGAATAAASTIALAAATVAAAAPFIAIGVAIAAVVGGVIYAYNHFETFRNIVQAVGRFFRDTLWPILKNVFGWLRDNVPPIIQGIIDVHLWLWNNVLSPLVSFLVQVFSVAWTILKVQIDIVITTINALITAGMWLWNNVLSPLVSFLGDVFSVMWAAVVLQIDLVTAAVGFVSDAASALWHDFLEPIVDFLGSAFTTALSGISTAIGAVGTAFTTLKTLASDAVEGAVGFIKDLPGKLLDLVTDFLDAGTQLGENILDGFKDGLSAVAGFAGDVADSIMGAVKDAWNAVAKLINDFIPNSLGWGMFSIDLPDNPIPTFATGGIVSRPTLAVIGDARGGEVVMNRPQMQDFARFAGIQASASGGGARTVIVRIGEREFEGYMHELADDRIDTSNRELASAITAGRRP